MTQKHKVPQKVGRDQPRGGWRRVGEEWREFRRFVHEELWDLDLAALPRVKKLGFSLVRMAVIVGKGLMADKCALQSSALSYITLVSLVPFLALSFAVARGLGAHERVMEIVRGQLAGLPEKTAEFVTQILELVNRVNYGALGSVGLLLIFLSVVVMLGRIENSFNAIWGVQKARSPFRKFTDYISVVVVVPIMMLLATSINTALSTGGVANFLAGQMGPLYWLYERLIGLSGVAVLCLAFAFLFMFMPNTKVKLGPALLGGILGGVLWYLAQRVYIDFQLGVTRANAIYGTFAAIPFFLGWLYVSWLTVLFGAEASFAAQNVGTYVLETASESSSPGTRELIGMTAVYQSCLSFREQGEPWAATEFARRNSVPARLMAEVAETLCEANILIRAGEEESETAYVPARDPERITLCDVADAFRGPWDQPARDLAKSCAAPAFGELVPILTELRNDLGNTNFRDLILREESSKKGDL